MFFKNISNGSTVHHFTSFLLIVVLDRIYRIHKIRLRAFPAILLILLILSKKLIQLLQLLFHLLERGAHLGLAPHALINDAAMSGHLVLLELPSARRVEEERTVSKPADKVIAPVLSHADIIPKTLLLHHFYCINKL